MGNTIAIAFLFMTFIFIFIIYTIAYHRIKKQIKELDEAINSMVEITNKSYNNIEIILNNHADSLDNLQDRIEDLEDAITGDVTVTFTSDFNTPPKKGDLN